MSGLGESGRKDRSKFSQTCTLLSRYIKEKGSGNLRDLAMDMMAPRFQLQDPKGEAFSPPSSPSRVLWDLNREGWVNPIGKSEAARRTDVLPDLNAATGEAVAPQMTIFYGGKVIVFDNFPEEKAREVIAIASDCVPTTQTCPSPASTSPPTDKATLPQSTPHPVAVSSADLPIARRVSLNRFLEKRKGRISSKAQYQAPQSPTAPAHEEATTPWLGLGPSGASASSDK